MQRITKATIPATVKIGGSAFYDCTKMTRITIGTGVTKIKVPRSKLKSYKKLLKEKGQGSKVTITK